MNITMTAISVHCHSTPIPVSGQPSKNHLSQICNRKAHDSTGFRSNCASMILLHKPILQMRDAFTLNRPQQVEFDVLGAVSAEQPRP